MNHCGGCYGLELPIELILSPKKPSKHIYLITIFFPAHFVYVWGMKTVIFCEIPSKTDFGEQHTFGGVNGRIILPQI